MATTLPPKKSNIFNRTISYCVNSNHAIALFGYNIVGFLVTDALLSTTITAPFRAIVLVLSLTFLSSKIFVGRSSPEYIRKSDIKLREKIKVPHYFSTWRYLLLFFIIIYSIRLLFDTSDPSLIFIRQPSDYIITWFLIVLVPSLSFIYIQKTSSKKLFKSCIIILTISSLLGLNLVFSGNTGTLVDRGRLAAQAINPISIGNCGVSLTILCLFQWIENTRIFSRNSFQILIGNLLLVPAGFGLILIFLSGSRGPILALGICLIILYSRNFKKKKSVLMLFILFFMIIFALIISIENNSAIIDRLTRLSDYSSDYSEHITRGYIVNLAISDFIDNPLFGKGIEVDGVGYPHNLIIEAFMSTGIFGGVIFLVLYLYALLKAFFILRSPSMEIRWIGLLFFQYATAALVSGAIYASYTFWYLLIAIINIKYIISSSSLER